MRADMSLTLCIIIQGMFVQAGQLDLTLTWLSLTLIPQNVFKIQNLWIRPYNKLATKESHKQGKNSNDKNTNYKVNELELLAPLNDQQTH